MYRLVEAEQPTLLIDEADTFVRTDEALRGVLNSGHTRSTAFVVRVVGDDHVPTKFSTFAFKAIAGIGRLADTISDRSIVVELRRKRRDERVVRLDRGRRRALGAIAAGFARWAKDSSQALVGADPAGIPSGLNDRQADNWRWLIAIADMAGGAWPERSRAAAAAISGGDAEPSIGVELLTDIKAIFDRTQVDRIAGADLVEELVADEERPWATFNGGRAISQAQVARRLSSFGIVSCSVRLPDGRNVKGYHRHQFADAFERYVTVDTDSDSDTKVL